MERRRNPSRKAKNAHINSDVLKEEMGNSTEVENYYHPEIEKKVKLLKNRNCRSCSNRLNVKFARNGRMLAVCDHCSTEKYICPICQSLFTTTKIFKKHFESFHECDKCAFCDFVFLNSSSIDIQIHLSRHYAQFFEFSKTRKIKRKMVDEEDDEIQEKMNEIEINQKKFGESLDVLRKKYDLCYVTTHHIFHIIEFCHSLSYLGSWKEKKFEVKHLTFKRLMGRCNLRNPSVFLVKEYLKDVHLDYFFPDDEEKWFIYYRHIKFTVSRERMGYDQRLHKQVDPFVENDSLAFTLVRVLTIKIFTKDYKKNHKTIVTKERRNVIGVIKRMFLVCYRYKEKFQKQKLVVEVKCGNDLFFVDVKCIVGKPFTEEDGSFISLIR